MLPKLKKSQKTMGLEFLALCRTGMDLRVEYENGDELKRLRQAYLLHIADYICQDRDKIFTNDMVALQEKNKDRVTLSNVFDIAEKNEKGQV